MGCCSSHEAEGCTAVVSRAVPADSSSALSVAQPMGSIDDVAHCPVSVIEIDHHKQQDVKIVAGGRAVQVAKRPQKMGSTFRSVSLQPSNPVSVSPLCPPSRCHTQATTWGAPSATHRRRDGASPLLIRLAQADSFSSPNANGIPPPSSPSKTNAASTSPWLRNSTVTFHSVALRVRGSSASSLMGDSANGDVTSSVTVSEDPCLVGSAEHRALSHVFESSDCSSFEVGELVPLHDALTPHKAQIAASRRR